MSPLKICIIGSGNWGSAIAKVIGSNTPKNANLFDPIVNMYVYEENVDGRKLTDIINKDHVNVKYLPGITLPDNVVAVPDIVEAGKNADLFVVVVPHQFIQSTCEPLKGKVKQGAFAISLVKGFIHTNDEVELVSRKVTQILGVDCAVLMGANLANEVAEEKFSESTIGCRDKERGKTLRTLIQTDYFRVTVVDDVETVEVCGALKNIVACGAGFVDGMGLGDNTKAAIIRIGLMEMIKYAKTFYPGAQLVTFLQSCGIADLVTTCYGGRNRKVCEAFAKTGTPLKELEKEMLKGQRLQGPQTAEEVYAFLASKNEQENFPLFVAINDICHGKKPVAFLIDAARNHPEHSESSLSHLLDSRL